MENNLILFISISCTLGLIIMMSCILVSSCCCVIMYVNSISYLNTVDEESQGITMSAWTISRRTEDPEMSQHQQFNADQGLVKEYSNK